MYKNYRYTKKLSKKDVLDIYTSKKLPRELAEKYNINRSTISQIKTKRAWTWWTNQIDQELNN